MRVNYHLHNQYSSDGRGSTAEVCERAFELGFEEICFTNHAETIGEDGDWVLDLVEARTRFEQLQHEIERLQPEYPEMRILLGAELEYRPEWVETLDALVDSVDFDMIVGSVHVVDGHQISGGATVGAYFRDRELEEAYGRYFETLAEMVDWGGFDVVGHFDLIKRFGAKHYGAYAVGDFEPQICAVLEKVVEKGLGIEVNTSGVTQAPAEPYPGLEVLRLAKKTHVATVTIGSDSHVPVSFEQGLEVGEHILRRAGFTEITLFSHRMRKNVPLPGLEEEDEEAEEE